YQAAYRHPFSSKHSAGGCFRSQKATVGPADREAHSRCDGQWIWVCRELADKGPKRPSTSFHEQACAITMMEWTPLTVDSSASPVWCANGMERRSSATSHRWSV